MKRWDEILMRIPEGRPVIGVEVGVYRGENAGMILDARPNLTLYLIDSWESWRDEGRGGPEDIRAALESSANLVLKHGDRARIIHWRSPRACLLFDAGTVDFVFIDARHSYSSVLSDAGAWRQIVRRSGWIGGHDYGSERFHGVKKAVDELFGEERVERGADLTWFVKRGNHG